MMVYKISCSYRNERFVLQKPSWHFTRNNFFTFRLKLNSFTLLDVIIVKGIPEEIKITLFWRMWHQYIQTRNLRSQNWRLNIILYRNFIKNLKERKILNLEFFFWLSKAFGIKWWEKIWQENSYINNGKIKTKACKVCMSRIDNNWDVKGTLLRSSYVSLGL